MLVYDTRDNSLYPSQGYKIKINALCFSEYFGSRYNFGQFLFDARRFFTIATKNNILGFHFYAELSTNHDFPFYKYPVLGSNNRLRGVEEERFIDRNSIFVQTEYRRFLWWRFNAVFFTGLGDVSHRLDDFSLSYLKYVAGAGLRIQVFKKKPLNIRIDYGLGSHNQSGFYIMVGEAF